MIEVSCALITLQSGEVLVTQRSAAMRLPLKWEFPGGKVEQGELPEECIVREIAEELGIRVEVTGHARAHVFDDGKQAICLIPFYCRMISGEICLTEHADWKWQQPTELRLLDWAEADLPIVEDYLTFWNSTKS